MKTLQSALTTILSNPPKVRGREAILKRSLMDHEMQSLARDGFRLQFVGLGGEGHHYELLPAELASSPSNRETSLRRYTANRGRF